MGNADFIVNPRRAPRAPARCHAHVSFPGGGSWASETEDIGPRGCQATAPQPVAKGEPVAILVKNDAIADSLRVTGRIAWCSPQAPFRVGIAFDEHLVAATTRWFEKLLMAHPGMLAWRRVPERIAVDTPIFLGPPPRFLVDFSAEEVAVLRQIGSGITVDDLRVRLRDRWTTALRAFFSLLARGHVTLTRGGSVHPDSWKKVLGEVEAALALEALGQEAPPAARPAAPAAVPVPPPVRGAARAGWPPAETGAAPPAEAEEALVGLDELKPLADFQGAGVGWRQPRARSTEAQSCYERALHEIEAGRVNQALALLRRAIALAPGDPEIAKTLGQIAFRDRPPRE